MLLDLIHEVSWSSVFWHNFLYFFVKKDGFGFLNRSPKTLPILYWFGGLVCIKFNIALLILPCFEALNNIDIFRNFIPN